MRPFVVAATTLAMAAALLWARPVSAQTSDNILLVVNDSSPASTRIGSYYARARVIQDDHVVHLTLAAGDEVTRRQYDQAIRQPIEHAIASRGWQDRILYIVLTKGVPLRISGTAGRDGTTASVDSELTLLYRRMTGEHPPISGRVANPYFLDAAPLASAKPFTHQSADIYLVTRLDGFTVDDVVALVDHARAPVGNGIVVLDERKSLVKSAADQWMDDAAARLPSARVILDRTPRQATPDQPVIGYYSWGSNDPGLTSRRSGLSFAAGAVGAAFVSTDGRTFDEPPADWTFSGPNGGPGFKGSFQSLAGDLIRDGITGTAANVAEPYLDATARPQVLFPAYLAGFNLAESFYLALPYLSWQTVVVGDPLCAPFKPANAPALKLELGFDPDTDYPTLFSARRLAVLTRDGVKPEAAALYARAEAHRAIGRLDDSEMLLTQAIALDPGFTDADLTLAALEEDRGEVVRAADRYRRVLTVKPHDVIATNNLAFNLAERQHKPKEALPLAEEAYRRTPQPLVADTLGWVQHLLGNDIEAVRLLDLAAKGGDEPEVLIHAAAVHLALSDAPAARKDIDAALALEPALKDRADVAELLTRLKNVGK